MLRPVGSAAAGSGAGSAARPPEPSTSGDVSSAHRPASRGPVRARTVGSGVVSTSGWRPGSGRWAASRAGPARAPGRLRLRRRRDQRRGRRHQLGAGRARACGRAASRHLAWAPAEAALGDEDAVRAPCCASASGRSVERDVGLLDDVAAAAAPSTLAAHALEDRDVVGVDADVVLLQHPQPGEHARRRRAPRSTATTPSASRSPRERAAGAGATGLARAAARCGSAWWPTRGRPRSRAAGVSSRPSPRRRRRSGRRRRSRCRRRPRRCR